MSARLLPLSSAPPGQEAAGPPLASPHPGLLGNGLKGDLWEGPAQRRRGPRNALGLSCLRAALTLPVASWPVIVPVVIFSCHPPPSPFYPLLCLEQCQAHSRCLASTWMDGEPGKVLLLSALSRCHIHTIKVTRCQTSMHAYSHVTSTWIRT